MCDYANLWLVLSALFRCRAREGGSRLDSPANRLRVSLINPKADVSMPEILARHFLQSRLANLLSLDPAVLSSFN